MFAAPPQVHNVALHSVLLRNPYILFYELVKRPVNTTIIKAIKHHTAVISRSNGAIASNNTTTTTTGAITKTTSTTATAGGGHAQQKQQQHHASLLGKNRDKSLLSARPTATTTIQRQQMPEVDLGRTIQRPSVSSSPTKAHLPPTGQR